MIEDKEKAKRLNEAYRYLYANRGVDSQTLFASQIGVQRSALSAAMNGNKLYLTKNLFMKICAAYPDTFNLDYLLSGEGTLLIENEKTQSGNEREHLINIIRERDKTIADRDKTIRDLEMMIDRYARLVDQINTQTKSTGGHIASDDMANIMDTPKK